MDGEPASSAQDRDLIMRQIGVALTQQAAATHALLARTSGSFGVDEISNADGGEISMGAKGARAMNRDSSARSKAPGKFAQSVRDMARAQVTVDPLCSDIRAQSMTAFLERCMGFNGGKTLCYMASGLAQVADLMLANMWREAEDLVLALFLACDQAAINDGKWFYAWQATHLPEPLDTALAQILFALTLVSCLQICRQRLPRIRRRGRGRRI
jgi:hypothetical protein